MIPEKVDVSKLPSLSITEISQLPQCSAIYLVVKDYSVVYVGQAINLADRWSSHHKWNQIVSLSGEIKIAWLECSDISLLTEIELALIQHFRPELNKLGLGKRSHPDYSQTTIYINKQLHRQMKAAFLEDGYEGNFSDWVEERAKEWLEKRS